MNRLKDIKPENEKWVNVYLDGEFLGCWKYYELKKNFRFSKAGTKFFLCDEKSPDVEITDEDDYYWENVNPESSIVNIILSDKLYEEIKIAAAKNGQTMNTFITEAVIKHIENKKESLV